VLNLKHERTPQRGMQRREAQGSMKESLTQRARPGKVDAAGVTGRQFLLAWPDCGLMMQMK
jgi:hypothetical protein